ncbi:hypothetical protein JHD46_08190 [Sulfurimonas sp. SAG-AH-194-C20]|nr:hypothetical protein [Sulfurimonas sp. SAG-AH-194-C20]MDF1879614.1 hypothetical protein [Sulfurimonas sp. SAG-AH-194-C20]
MRILLSEATSANYIMVKHSPIYGDETIDPESVKFGLWEKTITRTSELKCGETSSPSDSEECKVFGRDFQGDCVLSKRSTSSVGGTSGTPYIRETLTYVGVINA